MYETDALPVLRCELCNKPFDKESSLKRHGYYCRSRKRGGIARSRSCIACAKGKARCDNRQPECSRCLGKAIKCQYPAKASRGPGPRIQRSYDEPTQQEKAVPSLAANHPRGEASQEIGNDGDIPLDTALDMPDFDFAYFGGESLDSDMDFANLLNPNTSDESFDAAINFSSQTNQTQQAIYPPSVSIQAMPTYTIRSFNQRPKPKAGAQMIPNLILHTLKSYPRMMLRDNTLPPFIHPHLVYSNGENNDMEPLTNCVSLVHMLGSRANGSRKLFWKNVRMECERLCAEHRQLNKWELLAAMQALSIYILIRMDEGETEHNNFDFLLVTTVTVIASQFNSMDLDIKSNTESALYNYSLETSWKDWILKESARRLCVVYQVVNMLVYFEPAAMCDLHRTDLLLAPLPAKKQLWEASGELAWKEESEREPEGLQTAFGMAANGDLVRVDEDQFSCGDAPVLRSEQLDKRAPARAKADWEEWCSGMDGLGGLVMLAASLTAY